MLERIVDGRTDLVFEYLSAGNPANAETKGRPLIRYCAYYGDVSAIRFLLSHGESLGSLGMNFDLNGACFHGHWQFCQFLIEQGAEVDRPLAETGETPLHAALSRAESRGAEQVVRILLAQGADPNATTKESVETGAFMRDVRTRGETPLHRAAAFGSEGAIDALLEAGVERERRDGNGDSPLSWASWHQRPTAILRKLCFGEHRVHSERLSMEAYLLGSPHLESGQRR